MPTLHQYPVLMHGFVLQRPSNYCPSNFFDHPPFRTFMIPINYYLYMIYEVKYFKWKLEIGITALLLKDLKLNPSIRTRILFCILLFYFEVK